MVVEYLPLDYWQALEDVRCSVFTLYTSLDPAINRLNCRDPQENLEKWLMLDVRDLTAQLKQAYAENPVVKAERQPGYFVAVPIGTRRNREELASKLDAHLILTTRKACLRGLIRTVKDTDGQNAHTYTGPTLGPAYHGAVTALVYYEATRAQYQAMSALKKAQQPRVLALNPPSALRSQLP